MEKLKLLASKTVGIAGCGGLGSNCAAALTRVGIGKLILADFDTVSESNLNRQFFFRDQIGMKKVEALSVNLLRINPGLQLEAHDLRLDPENIRMLFAGCDVIVEAFDLAEMKQMIIETVSTVFPSVPLVSGIGLAGWGDNNALGEQRYGRLVVCGDMESEVGTALPPLAPRVGIVAHMEANAVLEILLGPMK